jgi:HEAT repeat protein
MDVKVVESVLAEVGKAFRLCRFYPASHPTVQQAMADLSAVLPSLAPVGTVEIRIGPTGLALGTTSLSAKSPQIQEFAGLLYAQGHRGIILQPGVTADEFAALIRATAGVAGKSGSSLGVTSQAPQLPHIQLESTSRKSATQKSRTPAQGMAAIGDGQAMSSRSTGVFRPNALPPDIEARRLTALLEVAMPAGALGPLARLGAVAQELASNRDFATLSEAVAALSRWERSEDPAAAQAAQSSLAGCINDGTLSGMVGLVAGASVAAEVRATAAAALGGLGERAVPALFDAYVAAADDAVREAYARAVAAAGPGAVRHLETRASSEQVEQVRAAATLLGALGTAGAIHAVAPLAHHSDAGVRRAALGSLATLGGPDASRLVVAALRDADPGVRFEAARGVGRLGDRGFAGIILGRLKEEPDGGVETALIETLGRLREVRAVTQLSELARGVSGVFQRIPLAVRVAAIRALARIGTPEALAAIEPYKSDKIPDVRNAALDLQQ